MVQVAIFKFESFQERVSLPNFDVLFRFVFFHWLECKPHMPLSWIGSSLRAFCRDSEPVLPVLISLPGLGVEHHCSECLCQVWKATEISLRLNPWASGGRSEVVVCLGLAAGHRWQRKAERWVLTQFNPSCWRWDMPIEKLKGWLGQRVEVCLVDDETHFRCLNVSWTGLHLHAVWPEHPAPMQTPASRHLQAGAFNTELRSSLEQQESGNHGWDVMCEGDYPERETRGGE